MNGPGRRARRGFPRGQKPSRRNWRLDAARLRDQLEGPMVILVTNPKMIALLDRFAEESRR